VLYIFERKRMPNNGVNTVSQAVDLRIVLAVDPDDLRRNVAQRAVRIRRCSGRNPVWIDAFRKRNRALDIAVKPRYFFRATAVNRAYLEMKRRHDQRRSFPISRI